MTVVFTTSEMGAKVSDLKQLSDAATPGAWRYVPGPNFDEADVVGIAHGYPAELGNFYCATGADEFEPLPGKANAAFVAALVNAYREGRLVEVAT
jgi:hypothetical protein